MLRRAIGTAERGWGRVHPNPLVGAVVAQGEEVVGTGAHLEFGREHAEVAALREAGARARGATLYVSLEPCAHHGKQPPCVDAIVAAGIARVVVAMRDPDPVAAGGAEALRRAGVAVELEPDAELLDMARFLNAPFLQRVAADDRPFVAVKLAVSMDGCIADRHGHSRWVSSEGSRAWVHRLRANFDAIAVGAETALRDDARLTVRGEVVPRVPPARVLFDRSGRIPANHGIFSDGSGVPVIMVMGHGVVPGHRAAIEAVGAEVVLADELPDALRLLRARGIVSLLVEGGGRLAGALLRAGLIDRVYQIQCPVWLGRGRPAWAGVDVHAIADAPRFRGRRFEATGGGDLLMVLER